MVSRPLPGVTLPGVTPPVPRSSILTTPFPLASPQPPP